MADAPAVLSGVLGGARDHGGSSGAYRFRQWRFNGGGRLEILEPVGTDGFLSRFLRGRGPGIHHVTFLVPSLREACERARAHGYDIVGYDDSEPEWREAFLHPRQALGIVVQLAESRWARAEALIEHSNAPLPVTILGLRMRAHIAERARRQWELVLGGRGTQGPGGELIFRWPRSAMRLAVELDPLAEEGALAIEYASERPIALPHRRHPVLGAMFTRHPSAQDGP